MSGVCEQLQQLGFSQYEAQAYVALLRGSPVNGYELAKASGIPRPNIYPVLQKLEEKGAILRVDGPDGARFAPVQPAELLGKLEQQHQQAVEQAVSALQELATPAAVEAIMNLRGRAVLLDQARALLSAAQSHLLLSIWPEEAQELSGEVRGAVERGVQITTLCLRGCSQSCPACGGEVFRYPLAPAGGGRWLVIVADEQELLAGEITSFDEALAVRTRQKMLVNLAGSSVQNSIALASILAGLGDRLESALEPHLVAAINSMHPLQAAMEQREAWLAEMRRRVHAVSRQALTPPPAVESSKHQKTHKFTVKEKIS